MAKEGKRIREARALVEQGKQYSLQEACELITKFPAAKFDETVEVAVGLGVDPRKAEENVRGTVTLPHGTGKSLRVLAFCKGEKVQEAKDAGADYAGADDLVEKIQGGWLDFEVAVATPDTMAQVGKIGKILGPRGLMPNPKVGTVTFEIGKAIQAVKAGRVEFRVEKAGIVHVGAGKLSFGSDKIAENVTALVDALVKAKPKASKGIYLKSINLTTTMGPGVNLDPVPFRA